MPALKFEIIFPEQEKYITKWNDSANSNNQLSFSFDDQSTLKVIVEDSENNNCGICSKTFRSHEQLVKHTEYYHKNTQSAEHVESPVIKEEADEDERMSEGRFSPGMAASESSMDPDSQWVKNEWTLYF